MKPVEKFIQVTSNVTIADLTVLDPTKTFYFLIADILGQKDTVQLKFHYDPKSADDEPRFRAKNHVANIIEIPGKVDVLSNIRLINCTAEEAEEKGLLHRPGVIEHQ